MLNAALIGLGWWGRTIAATLRDSAHLRLVAACDPAPNAAALAAAAGLPLAPSFEAVLADPAVQAVILCTPHSLHAAQVNAAARSGKHVFCEKPLCLTYADAVAAVAACQAAGVVLGVGHERRFEPPVAALRQLLADGALGTALQIEANFSQDKFLALPAENWRLSGAEAPAGPLTATGIHLLDLACSFLGPVEAAAAQVRQLGSSLTNGDTLGALLSFRHGGHALISAILATPFDGRFALYGSQGWAEIRDKAHPEQSEGWTLTVQRRGAEREVTDFPPAPAVRLNLEAFARAAAGGPAYPVSAAALLETVAAFEAVVQASRTGQVEEAAG